ncbi:MAG: LacI family DNA-binding transcriptional regulator [Caldilineaceae bacterium]|nr:LacI family DNA-binding transcriptional regulator [Caldilineaceae bacterium]
MAPKIADVADYAGVSTATVSRVLAGKPHVSEAMRTRVLSAVAELDYRPSRVARSLRARRANIIGLVVADIQNPFFMAVARGVEDIAYQRQFGVFLCNSDEDPEKEAFYIDLMLAEQVTGVIIASSAADVSHYDRLLGAGIPITAIDRRMPDLAIDTVRVDNIAAAQRLVDGLIEAGHTRIGAIVPDGSITTGAERRQGYESALRAHGLAVDEALIRMGQPRRQFGYEAACALLQADNPPTALFAGNNLVTVGALQALHDLSLQPGRDVAVAAFDELDWMSMTAFPLLVAAQPAYAMGRRAAELIFERTEQPDLPVQEVVLTARVKRES